MFVTNVKSHRVILGVKRHVHSCTVMCNSVNKQAKTMAKLLTSSYRKKKSWHDAEIMAKIPMFPANKKFQEGGTTKRRVDVLNKLFMRSITDLLATGEVAPYLIGHGISITKVKVAVDFSAVNVYWSAKGAEQDAGLYKNLEKAEFELRHHLCQLHIMGKVPRISFIKDKWQAIIEDTLRCIETTKGGPEEFAAQSNELEDDIEENPLPPMTHNVLGLDHAYIMSKIEKAVKKSYAKHRRSSFYDDAIPHVEDSVTDSSGRDYDNYPSDVAQYIAKQKIEKKKAKRALQKELIGKMEVYEKHKDEEYIDTDDGDFIEEFEAKKNYTELRE